MKKIFWLTYFLPLLCQIKIATADDIVKCPSQQTQSDPSAIIEDLNLNTKNVISMLSCTSISNVPQERFNRANCELKISCAKEMLRRDGSVFLDNPYIQKNILDSYVKLKLRRELPAMESIEAIKRYADKKYGEKLGLNCSSPFDYDSKNNSMKLSCDLNIMDSALGNMVNNCTEGSSESYCALKNSDMFSTFDSANANKSMTQTALLKQIDTNIVNALESDNDTKESIASIVNSSDADEIKFESLFIKLSELKKSGKLDPVLSLSLGEKIPRISDFKKSDGFKFFKKLIEKKTTDVKESIEKYRQDKARDLLGKSCGEAVRFSQICESATRLFDKRKILKDKRVVLNLAENENDEDLKTVLNNIFERADLNDRRVNIVMDAEKCSYLDNSFIPAHLVGKPSVEYRPESINFDIRSENSSSISSNPGIILKDKYSNQRTIVPGTPKTGVELFTSTDTSDSPVYPNYGKQELATKVPPIDFTSPNGDLKSTTTADQSTKVPGTNYDFAAKTEAGMPMEGYNTFFPGQQQINNFPTRPAINDGSQFLADDSLESNAKIANVKKMSSETESKIEELNKKLAASEENLESMKAEKEAAVDEKEHALKVIEENKTIADLKKEITDLRAKVQTPQIKESSQKVNVATPQSTSNSFAKISTGEAERRAEPQQVVREVVNTNAPVNNNNQFDSNIQNGVRSAMPQNAAAISSAKSGLVLTKINGNTTEKIAEGISEKILENDGTPFYIEEGGMIKEIIPVTENGKVVLDDKGKPLFEKVVKGKVGDKKFEAKKEERKPASITSKADLLRDQEKRLQYERAEYLKLKNITKQALDKK